MKKKHMSNATDSENHVSMQCLLTKIILNKPIIETVSIKLNVCMLLSKVNFSLGFDPTTFSKLKS